MKFVFILFGLAIALEMFGPFILSKIFPAQLTDPAPDVPVRPKRSGARNDALADEEDTLHGFQGAPSRAKKGHADGLVSTKTADAPDLSGISSDNFDYDEFRRENESAHAAISEPVHSEGVPDIFDDSVSATA